MKKTFFIFALIFSVSAKAQISCFDPFGALGAVSELVDNLLKDPCKDKLNTDLVSSPVNPEYCSCLIKSKSVLFQKTQESIISENPEFEAELKEASVKRRKRLDNLYRFLNFEVSLQENKYELTEGNKQVGCTPKAMASTMNDALCNKTSCATRGAGEAVGTQAGMASYQKMPWQNEALDGIDLTVNSTTNEINKKLENGMEFMKKLTPKEVGQILKAVGSEGFNSEELQRIDVIKASLKSDQVKLVEINNVTREANERIIKQNSMEGTTQSLIASPYELAFRNTFKDADERIKKRFDEDHKKSIENACVNYDVFKAIDGMPTTKLMEDWDKGEAAIARSLEPANLKNNQAMKNFLRRNPVIAKNMISKGQREKLAKALATFGSQNKNKNSLTVVDSFSAFMKTTIKELNKENEVGSLLQCDLLAQNYAAASDPSMGLTLLSGSGNQVTQLSNNVRVCQIQENNQKNITSPIPSLDEIVNANELFALFDSETDVDMFSPKGDESYKKFLEATCNKNDMKEIEKKYTSGFFRCMFSKSEKCRERARNSETGKRERILAEYYEKHKDLGALVGAIEKNTKKLDLDSVARKTNENKQNAEVRTQYDKYVKPIISQRSMYEVSNAMGAPVNSSSASGQGSPSAIAEAVSKAQDSYTSSHTQSQVADYGAAPATSVTSAAAGTSENSSSHAPAANPGQYIPPFLDSPKATKSSTPQKISSVDEARDVLEDMVDAPAEEKAELADRAKEYLNTQDQTNRDIADLQKKLDEYEKENHSAPIVAKDNTRVAVRAPASVAPVNMPTAINKAVNFGSSSFGGNSAPSSSSSGFAKLSQGTTVSKAAASYANALNQANESRTDAKSLSLVVESGAVFDFNNSPVTRSAGELVIGTSLEPSDKLYAEISSDPEAMKTYLSKNLKEIPVDKVVSIKCKGAGCNANAGEILLVITKGSDNKFSIRSVSRETKVARAHTIMNLKNEINKATR